MPESMESAVNAAYADVIAWQKEAKEALWRAPSRRQVKATIRAQFDRAEAAEALLGEVREALRRHLHAFTDRGGAAVCGGCLEDAPCPDAGLAAGTGPS